MKISEKPDLQNEINSIHEKLDRVLFLLEEIGTRKAKSPKRPKAKPLPLTQEEIDSYRVTFDGLYEKWLSGRELDVQGELDKFSVEDLRRFADANNLNVTSKMPSQKLLHLIGARFRERRQLRGATSNSRQGPELPE